MRCPIVVMGVSGSGKSTVGAALARRLGVAFLDADTLHPPANIAKMAAGQPLDDQDRYPWLRRVGEWLAAHRDGGVASCSALKRSYRDQLRAHCPQLRFLHLSGSADVIGRRLANRAGHFMPTGLLRSQLDTLEPLAGDEPGVVADLSQDVDAIIEGFLASFDGACPGA
ncbi:gluconokinase [Mycobacterium kansasii]|uniref:Gluconokinase n=3 Tax=Mycobacterium kansasii TaxID=1768 RepID=A0A1V3WBS5_MYCKA|nr:gluconokinase [Mycobacterium kansasii]ETZ97362.1 carbohydrate kinase, thermoresistant glucokinase family protein [Mycobacterium kansasii 824]ARG64950.1 gluconate kinase [Mycobacterium kansasii]ARG73122.1 gluconate kinase [Mycobacterium kansasii]ARG77874.1 gluconate kinase [Mycobacterium kansasii]ARG83323.1 gluconate kinase [Mycobacterium kansasii]